MSDDEESTRALAGNTFATHAGRRRLRLAFNWWQRRQNAFNAFRPNKSRNNMSVNKMALTAGGTTPMTTLRAIENSIWRKKNVGVGGKLNSTQR
jgi:hypothetical protein